MLSLIDILHKDTDAMSTNFRKVHQVLSTRSVGMNLARPFKAGKGQRGVRVA